MRSGSLAALFFVCSALHAADPTGTITGRVLDPTGGAVLSAKISVTNLDTGFKREATAASDGGYVFPLLPVGVYVVAVEADGFRRFEQRGVEVRADESAAVPITLQVGSASQSVTVDANAEIVQTQSGALRDVVT